MHGHGSFHWNVFMGIRRYLAESVAAQAASPQGILAATLTLFAGNKTFQQLD
jgi:hypothetical protein